METSAGCLTISGLLDVCAEENIECAFWIYSFSVRRHLKRNRRSKEIRRNKKVNTHTVYSAGETINDAPVEDCSFSSLMKKNSVSELRMAADLKASRTHLFWWTAILRAN